MSYPVSNETKQYLSSISHRVQSYANMREHAIEHVTDLGIYDNEILTNCVVMSMLWLAAVRGEEITQNQIFMHLGLPELLEDDVVMTISEEMFIMSIDDVLNYTIDHLI